MKLTLSELFWIAANEKLAVDESFAEADRGRVVYSCDAIGRAVYDSVSVSSETELLLKAHSFAGECGCPVNSTSLFDYIADCAERQQVRYAWLMLLSQIAEEEGL